MKTTLSAGVTRLVELPGILSNRNRLFVKMECDNPLSGSHYDRVYLHLISTLQTEGKINPKTHILLENSSGNAALALAVIGKKFGYSVTLVRPPNIPPKKIELCRQLGAEVILSQTQSQYVSGTLPLILGLKGTRRASDGKEYFFLNHSANKRTPDAMAPFAAEIIQDFPSGANLDYFVPALGNGTSSVLPARLLKARFPSMRLIGYESYDAPVVYEMKHPGRFEALFKHPPKFEPHLLFGTSAFGVDFKFLREGLDIIDGIQLVHNNEWAPVQAQLESKFGYRVGPTSAAGVLVTQRISKDVENKNFLSIFYDSSSLY